MSSAAGNSLRATIPRHQIRLLTMTISQKSHRADYAVVVGPEWPQVRVKLLAERREVLVSKDELPALLGNK